MAIVSGFSFGVDKAEVLAIKYQFLGEIVGREFRETTDHHRKAILEYPEPIPDVPALRRFLGVVNWVRLHEPAEFAQAARLVTKYLSNAGEWSTEPPYMGEDGIRGVKALKALSANLTRLVAIDEGAALDGTRPLEQIGDWNNLGWGGCCIR